MRVARPSTGRVVGIPTADLMNIQHQRSTFLLRHSLQAKLSSDNGRLAFPYAEVNSAHLVCVTHMRSRRPLSKLRDQYSRFTLSPRCNQYETLCKSTTISSLSSNMRFICECRKPKLCSAPRPTCQKYISGRNVNCYYIQSLNLTEAVIADLYISS